MQWRKRGLWYASKGVVLVFHLSLVGLMGVGVAQAQHNPCPYLNDGDCDEPEGLGFCAEGTDVADCSNPNSNYGTGSGYAGAGGTTGGLHNPCPYLNDGDCDEPEGLGFCAEGTDVADCSNPNSNYGTGSGYAGAGGGTTGGLHNPCPYLNDGDCDEPEGLGFCAEGTDVADCANPNSNYGTGSGYAGAGGVLPQMTCPQGQVLMNGACQAPQPTTCPQGQMLVNGACQIAPQPTCPQGFIFVNGVCQVAQQQPQPQPQQPQPQPQQPQPGDEPCPAGQERILGVCQQPSGTPIN